MNDVSPTTNPVNGSQAAVDYSREEALLDEELLLEEVSIDGMCGVY